MTYDEVRAAARGPMGPCRVCPVCDGKACGSTIPGCLCKNILHRYSDISDISYSKRPPASLLARKSLFPLNHLQKEPLKYSPVSPCTYDSLRTARDIMDAGM